MNHRRLVVVGAAGFGREVLNVVDALNAVEVSERIELLGVLDDAPSAENLARLTRRGVAHLGGVDDWLRSGKEASFVVALGQPKLRRDLVLRFLAEGLTAATLVHPSAVLAFGVTLAAGVVVCAGSQVSTEVQLGAHTHLNPNSTIGHDSILEDYVSVNPGAIVSGACYVGEGSLLGAGSVILQGLRVGANAVVGAAACVTHDVAPGATVVGVPARPRSALPPL